RLIVHQLAVSRSLRGQRALRRLSRRRPDLRDPLAAARIRGPAAGFRRSGSQTRSAVIAADRPTGGPSAARVAQRTYSAATRASQLATPPPTPAPSKVVSSRCTTPKLPPAPAPSISSCVICVEKSALKK